MWLGYAFSGPHGSENKSESNKGECKNKVEVSWATRLFPAAKWILRPRCVLWDSRSVLVKACDSGRFVLTFVCFVHVVFFGFIVYVYLTVCFIPFYFTLNRFVLILIDQQFN